MEYPVRTDVEFSSISKTISQLSSLSRFVQIKISIPFTATGYSTILLNINPFHKFCRCFARISFIKLQQSITSFTAIVLLFFVIQISPRI